MTDSRRVGTGIGAATTRRKARAVSGSRKKVQDVGPQWWEEDRRDIVEGDGGMQDERDAFELMVRGRTRRFCGA